MSLRLTNTLTKRTEIFSSLEENKASIYCCGVTVYDLCHLGHARSYIAWDVLRRFLIWQGYQVTFVQNFTDIDDKIINRAAEKGCTMDEISEKNIHEFHKDMDALGILRPDKMPRATKCLNEIISLIMELEEKGAAYSMDGDVYFSVMDHKNYGKLSQRDLEEQKVNAGGRIEEKEGIKKKNELDFALWKKSKMNEPGYSSQWGKGRPGWHIECSAMVKKELGETIDIHLGGADLIFPHHENEIAQSESATGKELARYWLHNGMVNVSGKKMSKSLGNFTTIRALLENGISPMSLRLFVLQTHYRKPIDFSDESLKAASNGWEKINTALLIGINNSETLNWPTIDFSSKEPISAKNEILAEQFPEQYKKFLDAMNNDLNTSAALSVIFELAGPLKSLANKIRRKTIGDLKKSDSERLFTRWKLLFHLCKILGLKAETQNNSIEEIFTTPQTKEIEDAIKQRLEAKLQKDFDKADLIRDRLKDQGIELIDKPGGSTEWIRS